MWGSIHPAPPKCTCPQVRVNTSRAEHLLSPSSATSMYRVAWLCVCLLRPHPPTHPVAGRRHVHTGMSKLAPGEEGKMEQVVCAAIPVGHMGDKADIALACVYLASSAGR